MRGYKTYTYGLVPFKYKNGGMREYALLNQPAGSYTSSRLKSAWALENRKPTRESLD
jgi:hypothetical protein